MAKLRSRPMIWVTWLKDYLHGKNHCHWAIWRQIFYVNDSNDEDYSKTVYAIRHTALLNEVKKRYIAEGFEIIPELKVKVPGKIADLIGKIDLVAIKDNVCQVVEVKTGHQNPSDKIQTLLYIWALPRAHSRFKGMYFDGVLIYEGREIEISALDLDEEFIKHFSQFTKEIVDGEPDRKYPSADNCRYCKIRQCDERYTYDSSEQSNFVSDYF